MNCYNNYKANRFYGQLIKENSLCFDIGANHGQITSRLLKTGARVVAVEPQPKLAEELRSKFSGSPVTVVNAAAGSTAGEVNLYLCDQYDECATISGKFMEHYSALSNLTWHNKQVSACTTLNNLIDTYGLPHFCKIDTEGYEQEVIKGLSSVIPVLQLEFNKPFIHENKQVVAMLINLGYTQVNIVLHGQSNFLYPTWLPVQKAYTFFDEKPFSELPTCEVFFRQ